jgi:hypothetical protein
MSKPRVFFDITADGKSVGRIIMEVSLVFPVRPPALPAWWAKKNFENFIGMVSPLIIFAVLFFHSSAQMSCQRLLVRNGF